MRTILIVDDSASMRALLVYTLEEAGFIVTEAVDGEDGLAETERRTFDLIITDQNMPKLDGLSLIRELRQDERYRSIPIMVLTTECSEEMKKNGRDAGATCWLVKPFDPTTLIEVINKVLRK